MAGVRQIVDGPGFVPLPNFLWDAAEHPSTADPHWQQGVTWIERCGGGGTVYDECLAVTGSGGTPAAQASMSSNVTQTNRGATAFTVHAEFDCAPVGNGLSAADLTDRAEEALLRREPYIVSKAFWTGQAGTSGSTAQQTVWPHLASNSTLADSYGITLQTAATQLVTGGEDVAVALGAVETQLAACYGGQGAIHIPYSALPTFAARGLVKQESPGGPIYTPAGNRVVPGLGYDGSSPAGGAAASGTSWIYGTGPLFAYRSDVFAREFPSTFDRSENTVKYLASRTYLFGFGCCHVAALTTLGVPT